MSQKIHISSWIKVIAKYLTQTFILTCCQLNLIYCPYLCFALCLPSNQWFWDLYCTNKNMIAEYIVLSNIISVVSNNILRICIQEPLLILKITVPLHTLSPCNSLLVCYKVYSSDHRELLHSSWSYDQAYKNFRIDPAPCRNNPMKKQTCHTKSPGPTTRKKLRLIKVWQLKFA